MIQQVQSITILLLCLFVVVSFFFFFFGVFFYEESCLDSSAELCSAVNRQNPCSCKNRCATRKCPCKLNRIPCGSYCHVGRTCSNKPSVKPDPEEVVNVDEQKVAPSIPWVKIGITSLLEDDKKLLTGCGWLTDNIMFAALQLLHQQHPDISGLQDPALQITRTFDVQGSREFIQCLNMSGCHWITISTVGCDPATIKIYDSSNLMLTSTLKRIVADLMHTSGKSISILYMDMQYQIGKGS